MGLIYLWNGIDATDGQIDSWLTKHTIEPDALTANSEEVTGRSGWTILAGIVVTLVGGAGAYFAKPKAKPE